MLDIKLIRENPDTVRNNLKMRGDPENEKMLESLIDCDKRWRGGLTRLNELRHERKQITAEIATTKKKGEDAKDKISKAKETDSEISVLEGRVGEWEEKVHDLLMRLPNLLHETVPTGKDENDNVEIRKWGKIPRFSFPVKGHIDLGLDLDVIDIERAGKIAGARFFFLKNEAVFLDNALINFALEEMSKKGYKPIEPPYMIRRKPYEGVVALSDFEDVLYKIENEDLYLIATAEHPVA
jgi:seryl-tRNA synthetase